MSTAPTMQRTVIEPGLADLGFAIDIPDGFVQPPFPQPETDFDNPTFCAPVALFSSPVALAIIAVAARPAYATGSVLQWTRYLAGHAGLDLQHVLIRSIGEGNAHPAITAFATQVQDGVKLNVMLVMFEDGGRLITAQGMCPAELWPSFGTPLSNAVESLTLLRPKGQRHDLDSTTEPGWGQITPDPTPRATTGSDRYLAELAARRAPAVVQAKALLEDDRFDEAERAIMAADKSIYGNVEIANLYQRHLTDLVASTQDTERLHRVYRRALSWAQNCYPEPHTQDEADSYASGRAQDRARLVAILGHDPDAHTNP